MSEIGKTIIVFGVVLVLIGILITYSPKIPFLGKLPGDFLYKKDGFTFYFPFATSIVISIIFTIIINIFFRK